MALCVIIEVFPAKLQYQDDYGRLLSEAHREVHNLAFDFLQRAYLKAKFGHYRQARLTEFNSVISSIFCFLGFEIDGRTVRVIGDKVLLDEAVIATVEDLLNKADACVK